MLARQCRKKNCCSCCFCCSSCSSCSCCSYCSCCSCCSSCCRLLLFVVPSTLVRAHFFTCTPQWKSGVYVHFVYWARVFVHVLTSDCFATYFTHNVTCVQSPTEWTASVHALHMPKPSVTRVRSATQWTASVHTLHMSKPNVTRVQMPRNGPLRTFFTHAQT